MGTFTNAKPTGATGTGQTFTSVSGARATSNVGANAAIREVQEGMLTYQPYQTPILTHTLSNKLAKKPTGNQKFEWMNRSLLPLIDTVTTTGGSTSEDAITVGDSTLYKVGTKFVFDASGIVVIVDSIASALIDITVVGSGNVPTVTSGGIHLLGASFEQGSPSATALSVNKNFAYNYVEIFKKSVNETESQQATVEYGPVDWDDNKAARLLEFKMEIENNLIHGIRDQDSAGYQVGSFAQNFTGGIFDSTAAFITTTYAYTGDVPDETYFFGTFLKGLFSKGSNRKRLYAGANLVLGINDYSKVKQQTKVTEKQYGVDVQSILCPFGILELVWHPMLDGDTFSKRGFVIDQGMGGGFLKYRYLSGNGKNRDLQWRDYGEYFKESDQRKGEWLGEIGLQIDGDEYHALLKEA